MSFASCRKKAGLTQMQVAKKLKITDSAVCQWESGDTMPTAKRLVELAKLYKCTVDKLLKED